MTYQSHGFTFEDSIARANEVYEVEFLDWGVRSFPPSLVPDPNLQFPPPSIRSLVSSVAAVAIGPRSTVDRCWMTWDQQKPLKVAPADTPNPELVISAPRIITSVAPLLFTQATRKGQLGPLQSWQEAMQLGLCYVFPFGPRPNMAGQVASGNAAQAGTFGTTTILPATYTTMFGEDTPFVVTEKPFLQLVLYPKLPRFSPPTKRASMLRSGFLTLAVDAEGYFARVPIFGRKHVSVQLISHNYAGVPSQIVDFRIGLVRNVNENPIGAESPVFEVKAAEALAVPKDTPVNFSISNPCADYLTIHVKNGNVGPAGGAWTMVAED
jgi:hypothetical protein